MAGREAKRARKDGGEKLWGGRFETKTSNTLEKFSESISYDQRLYREDIAGSTAHATMLETVGLLSAAEGKQIREGLEAIGGQIARGEFAFRADREDIHMNIEGALIEAIGEPARKLHTARSRNDQVNTDVRLYVRREIDETKALVRRVQRSLVSLANANRDLVIPGYTHLQRAQPVLAAHYLLAYVEMLERDIGRLDDARARLNRSPLGACALAGTGLPIDRAQTSELLGFSEPLANSIDAVSDRDFVVEVMSALSVLAMHLSRVAEEWVLWTTEEFSFLKMNDAVATGSSIMPQKKNPDPMELVRGKCARVYGNLVTLLTLCKGLPLAYNRDLQEDKEPLFDSIDTVKGCLEMTADFADNVTFNGESITASLSRGFLDATTLADYLVTKGVPFRTGHSVVGTLVGLCVRERKIELSELSLDQMRAVSDKIDKDVYNWLGVANAVARFRSFGSTGKERVMAELDKWVERLA